MKNSPDGGIAVGSGAVLKLYLGSVTCHHNISVEHSSRCVMYVGCGVRVPNLDPGSRDPSPIFCILK